MWIKPTFAIFLAIQQSIAIASAEQKTLRLCRSLSAAFTCDERCKDFGPVEFKVSTETNSVVMKWQGVRKWDTSIKQLGKCGVWDSKNWECVEGNPNEKHRHSKMIDGHFIDYVRGQKPSEEQDNDAYCSK